MNAASPIRITGPAGLIAAVPYLLGFEPANSLVLIGLHDGHVTVTARTDLADLAEPGHLDQLMTTLAIKAQSSEVLAITYGDIHRSGADTVADSAAAAGMNLTEHVRVADGRYWSLTCPVEGCCPAEGRPLPSDDAVAAEFVALGVSKAVSRADLDTIFTPVPDTDRLTPLVRDAERAILEQTLAGHGAARITADKRALFAATRRTDRQWSDTETARYGVALDGYDVRDATWLAIENGRIDGRDLFLHLSRTLPATHRAPALFLFGWKTWREGNGALASMAVERALDADPTYSAADLLMAAITQAVDPRTMPRLRATR